MSDKQDVVAQTDSNVGSEQATSEVKMTAAQKRKLEKMASTKAESEIKAETKAETYPKTVILANRTYAKRAYPELGGLIVEAGQSVEVQIANEQVMNKLERNVLASNSIGHWVVPQGVFIEPCTPPHQIEEGQ